MPRSYEWRTWKVLVDLETYVSTTVSAQVMAVNEHGLLQFSTVEEPGQWTTVAAFRTWISAVEVTDEAE